MKGMLRFIFLALVIWAAGFVWFVHAIGALKADDRPCEGIVVLTGGTKRIPHGFDLLEVGRADKMFITGVGSEHDPNHFIDYFNLSAALREKVNQPGVLTLDLEARSTYANAEQTTEWLEETALKQLCLVTSNYHMLRSLVVFRHAMPQADWVIEPVIPASYDQNRWWEDEKGREVLFSEYHKFIAAWVIAQLT